jgi:hypothetical protein
LLTQIDTGPVIKRQGDVQRVYPLMLLDAFDVFPVNGPHVQPAMDHSFAPLSRFASRQFFGRFLFPHAGTRGPDLLGPLIYICNRTFTKHFAYEFIVTQKVDPVFTMLLFHPAVHDVLSVH